MSTLNPIPTNTANGFHQLGFSQPRAQMYGDPQGLSGSPVQSSNGLQAYENAFYIKKIIESVEKKRHFSRLADTITMPKHRGKQIKASIDIPVLDDRNLNDQGIDARGVQIRNGNFYGSSKDIGRILGSMPILTEEGGRVNRFGFSRTETTGTFNNFGIYFEYTRDLEDFDSDPQLISRQYQKAIETAQQISEDNLQVDLLNGAGTVIMAGNAISDETMNESSMITFQTIRQLSKALHSNNTPKRTKYIFGSEKYDTRTAVSHYTMFVGYEVLSILEVLKDQFGNPAFIPAHQYGASLGGKIMEDEVGIIGDFRVILVDSMKGWYGAGAVANPEFGLATQDGRYNIYPALVLGEGSFTTISFDGTNGFDNKFIIKHVKPEQNFTSIDPYGKTGFVSIQWWYGILFQKPERIGLIKTVAPM